MSPRVERLDPDGTPQPGDARVAATQRAARGMAALFDAMVRRGEDGQRALRFVLRWVVAMFAEDADRIRLTEPVAPTPDEVRLLDEARGQDWSKVDPPIFGALFQRSVGAARRHALGAHFTREADIQKIVTPTIVRPWRARIARARTAADLLGVGRALASFRVLDPACGSGDFLYVAYRALKRVETELLARIHEAQGAGARGGRGALPTIRITQLHGIDREPLAVELAKVTLSLAEKLAREEANAALGAYPEATRDLGEPPTPFEDLDDTLRCDDALFCAWPRADAIIGNPPYQSKNKAQQELGRAYMNRVRKAYPDVPGQADYCVYWFRRAHDELPPGGRAGLVGTNTIRQNGSRVGGLDHIVANGGTITEAVSTQAWPGDAVLGVSIVNWIKGEEEGKKTLHVQSGDREGAPWERYELSTIHASLSPRLDVTTARDLRANLDPKTTFQGQTPGHGRGFVIPAALAARWIAEDAANAQVLFAYLVGRELLDGPGRAPRRMILDFGDRDAPAARRYEAPFEHVRRSVLGERRDAAREEAERNAEALADDARGHVNRHHARFLDRWWRLSFRRRDMLEALSRLGRYVACSRVTRRPIFEFVSAVVRPGDALQVFALDDDYTFGVLQSDLHWRWFTERCSGLKIDPRYTSDSVYGTFPWPQAVTPEQARAVGAAGAELRALRRSILEKEPIGLRRLYRRLDLPGPHPLKEAHRELDAAVRAAYGMEAGDDPLRFLLDLNHRLAASEAQGRRVMGAGVPPSAGAGLRAFLVSRDCVRF